MEKIDIKSNYNGEKISINIHKKHIAKDKQGFVPVKNHPMYLNTINYEYLINNYKIPEDIIL